MTRLSKIAISGKGGVGKTTLCALLAQIYAERGRQVTVIDADPVGGLAQALGFPDELIQRVKPVAEMDDLIYERTGAKPGTSGGFFRMSTSPSRGSSNSMPSEEGG